MAEKKIVAPVKGSVRDKKLAIVRTTKKMEAGVKAMQKSVNEFKAAIEEQKVENKKAVNAIFSGVRKTQNDIKAKKAAFKTYLDGPFKQYIKTFWG